MSAYRSGPEVAGPSSKRRIEVEKKSFSAATLHRCENFASQRPCLLPVSRLQRIVEYPIGRGLAVGIDRRSFPGLEPKRAVQSTTCVEIFSPSAAHVLECLLLAGGDDPLTKAEQRDRLVGNV